MGGTEVDQVRRGCHSLTGLGGALVLQLHGHAVELAAELAKVLVLPRHLVLARRRVQDGLHVAVVPADQLLKVLLC